VKGPNNNKAFLGHKIRRENGQTKIASKKKKKEEG